MWWAPRDARSSIDSYFGFWATWHTDSAPSTVAAHKYKDKIISEVTEGKRGSALKPLKDLPQLGMTIREALTFHHILKKTFPLNSQLKYLLIIFPPSVRNLNPSPNQSLLLI